MLLAVAMLAAMGSSGRHPSMRCPLSPPALPVACISPLSADAVEARMTAVRCNKRKACPADAGLECDLPASLCACPADTFLNVSVSSAVPSCAPCVRAAPPAACVDTKGYCKAFKQASDCTKGIHVSVALLECPLACGLCATPALRSSERAAGAPTERGRLADAAGAGALLLAVGAAVATGVASLRRRSARTAVRAQLPVELL
ncbi:hypothetical protein KFE25_011117 [Diacronema lutheri]|uniref:ShKT domain-containing protein n=1 Tax=Diacronema lutheri TaxID=2081491 RepID=A0A8J5XPK6_DIALT|nr:hypothetical protein KFE25_011117 [Diacronema lutheri]